MLVENWYIDAVHLLTQHTHDHGASATEHIRSQLSALEGNETIAYTLRNANSITDRFRDLKGLQYLIGTELTSIKNSQQAALTTFNLLTAAVVNPPARMYRRAGSCGRCRDLDRAIVCDHCKFDEKLTDWEARLFILRVTAMEGGKDIDMTKAARREYEMRLLQRMGRGGLGEVAALDQEDETFTGVEESGRRSAAEISTTTLVHHPSQIEQALRHVYHQLKTLRLPPELRAQQEVVLAAAKVQLDGMESTRKKFVKIRSVCLAQRQKLYALDELEMCTMRMR